MNSTMQKQLLAPYTIAAGVVPMSITRCLPKAITGTSAWLFGTPANKDIKGIPAAAIRLLKLTVSDVRKIKKAFDRIDEDEKGKVSLPE